MGSTINKASWVGAAPTWLSQTFDGSQVHAPASGTIIADTGGLSAGYYDITIMISTDAAASFGIFDIQYRNADNNATILSFTHYTGMNMSFSIEIKGFGIGVGERWRGVAGDNVLNDISCSIIAIQRA